LSYSQIDYSNKKMKPIDELVFLFGKFGWQTRLCDLTETQVNVLIYALQNAEDIDSDRPTGELDKAYFESTGAWPLAAIPF
jgi:hypothetical protein